MEPISVALVVVNSNGVVTALDGPADRFGIGADVVGRTWDEAFAGWDVPSLSGQDVPLLPCRAYATAPTGEAVSIELFRIASGGGEPSVVALFRGALARTIAEKQQHLCSLGELSASVAHEMNNALTLVVGWLDLLHADMAEDDPNRATIELVIDESTRISKLANNLLDVARGADTPPRPLDIGQTLEEVLALVRNDMQNSNIKVESRLAGDLPPICGTSARLKQALLNLLLNARQAMPSGGSVTVSADVDAQSFVRVAVEDSGCGIPKEARGRVFNPFFSTKENGTGLGLSVTRRIVEDHGGSLQLESEPGVGTRFTMRFPATVQ